MPSRELENFEDVIKSDGLDDFNIADKELYTNMFRGLVVYTAPNTSSLDSNFNGIGPGSTEASHCEPDYEIIKNIIRFANGIESPNWQNDGVTHIICPKTSISLRLKSIIAR